MWVEDDGMDSSSMVKNLIASTKIGAARFVRFNGIVFF
jgi:sporulation-control protein spo0M